ncbi:flagellar hook-associated protein FlgK [Pelosinus sp. sgz500959]|uniref:flagellar hook-associated protein FlgK n=1 Tax=Pelosinus sp. sgz500959 TaxID=3242472 RepID=UPI00366C2D22
MASTFMGLSIASRGLSASQTGLATTTTNMSNMSTTGYSRQVLNQTSVGPAAVYSSSLVGAGAEVISVDRVRSDRLDQKYWQENSGSSKWNAKSTYLSQLETIFGTTDSSTISTALNTFTTDLGTLSTDPTDTAVRATVLEDAKNFCSTLNDTSTQLTQLRSDINNEVKTTVEQINSYTTQIADLNQKIGVAKASGAAANELEDQQGVLVDKLSGLIGISTTKSDDGIIAITVNGSTLVSGNKAKQLECYTVTDTTSAQYGMYGIRDAATGRDFASGDSGALNGYIQVRDGSTSDNKGIPYYSSQLDQFAQTLAKAFNEGITVDTTSYSGNADGVGLNDTTDIRFFSYDNLSSADLMASGTDTDSIYKNIKAGNITVSKDIQEDSSKIATSSTVGEDSNNTNITDLISIITDTNIFGNSTATGFYSSIIATVGTASSYAKTEYSRKDAITSYIDTSRSSVSAVSSDEETVNLTKYQQAYAASASVATKWSEIYETTINMVNV